MHSSGHHTSIEMLPSAAAGSRVTSEERLREKLNRIEAPYAGASILGEKTAAGAAADRIRRQFETASKAAPSQQHNFSIPDPWSRQLIIALCRGYGVRPFRFLRMHRQAVMINAPPSFLRDTLWPEFKEFGDDLTRRLLVITEKINREEVHAATSDAEEIEEPRRLR